MAKITEIELPDLEGATEAELWQAIAAIRQVASNGDSNTKEQSAKWLELLGDSNTPARIRAVAGRLMNELGDNRDGVFICEV